MKNKKIKVSIWEMKTEFLNIYLFITKWKPLHIDISIFKKLYFPKQKKIREVDTFYIFTYLLNVWINK